MRSLVFPVKVFVRLRGKGRKRIIKEKEVTCADLPTIARFGQSCMTGVTVKRTSNGFLAR